ncbi:hypothetical protein I7I51_03827 [Histoplasma capsulatum]|uniref:Uncharacterized protein n=1 Tax=Ajellomyces capsulatus TaxID=5037 RepID=A0A8A1M8T0_AJECA|nr:predicted protein [Histoplasma mississippiense (nom. inval.)]EDN08234.1 predicted protein [Histoplasma mississippiense (nom. inval.)]QSS61650.1 hypothetical protein I7I51_03827 [Histoplasma capsulatum]
MAELGSFVSGASYGGVLAREAEASRLLRVEDTPAQKVLRNGEILRPSPCLTHTGRKQVSLEQGYYDVFNLLDIKIPLVEATPQPQRRGSRLTSQSSGDDFDSCTGDLKRTDCHGLSGMPFLAFACMSFTYAEQAPSLCNGPKLVRSCRAIGLPAAKAIRGIEPISLAFHGMWRPAKPALSKGMEGFTLLQESRLRSNIPLELEPIGKSV